MASSRNKAFDPAELRRRRIVAMRLQKIEGNPLSADDIAMFEMFFDWAGEIRTLEIAKGRDDRYSPQA